MNTLKQLLDDTKFKDALILLGEKFTPIDANNLALILGKKVSPVPLLKVKEVLVEYLIQDLGTVSLSVYPMSRVVVLSRKLQFITCRLLPFSDRITDSPLTPNEIQEIYRIACPE